MGVVVLCSGIGECRSWVGWVGRVAEGWPWCCYCVMPSTVHALLAFDGGCLFCAAMEAHDGDDRRWRVLLLFLLLSCRVLSMFWLALVDAAMEAHDGCDEEARVMF